MCVDRCFTCTRVSGCCRRLLWLCLGVRLQGGLLMGVHLGVVDVWGLRCEILGLSDACGFSMMCIGCCVFGDLVFPLVSLASVGSGAMRERLRSLGCGVGVWWLGLFIVVL